MTGDLLDHEYVIERGGDEVAAVSKRWLTVRGRTTTGTEPAHVPTNGSCVYRDF